MRGKYKLIIITPVWPSQPWYTQLLTMSIKDPILIHPFPNLLTDTNQNQQPLNQTLSAWKVSDKSILQKLYQTKQMTCLKVAEDWAHCIIMKQGGESGVAGVFQEFLSNLFSEGLEYKTSNVYRSAISAYHEKSEGMSIG